MGIIAAQVLPFCGEVSYRDVWCFGREEGESMLMLCGTDANVLGLWASIERWRAEKLEGGWPWEMGWSSSGVCWDK